MHNYHLNQQERSGMGWAHLSDVRFAEGQSRANRKGLWSREIGLLSQLSPLSALWILAGEQSSPYGPTVSFSHLHRLTIQKSAKRTKSSNTYMRTPGLVPDSARCFIKISFLLLSHSATINPSCGFGTANEVLGKQSS